MESIDPSCRPSAAQVSKDNYAYKLVMALGNECVSENLTFFNAAKYVSLVGVTAGSFALQAHPATAFLSAATLKELKSDGAKCVVRAIIEASDEGAAWKSKWKTRAMAGFSVLDWQEFTKSAPSLAEGGKLQAIGGAIRDGFGAWERGTELGDFAGLVAGAVQGGQDAVNTYIYGETDTLLGHVKRLREGCDYRAARASLNRALSAAQNECKAYAAEYSHWDTKLNNYIARHYVTRNNLDNARVIVNNTIKSYRRTAKDAAADLKEFSATFKKIEDLSSELERDEKAVQKEQNRYAEQLGRTRAVLDQPAACFAIGELRNTLQNLSGECHRQFLRRLRSDGLALPEDVEYEMANAARQRVTGWWDRLDEIKRLYRTCNIDQGAAKASKLRSDVLSNPVQVRTGDRCGPVDQPHLMAALDGLRKPAHCEDTTVPRDLLGATLSDADTILEDAKLFVGELVRVDWQEGQTPNTVIASDPEPGKSVRVWTGVKLTVVKPAPAVELVKMPEVLGLEGEKAANLVRGAGLNAEIVPKAAADKLEKKPGYVYAAGAATEDELPKGTMVTLSTYGNRPMVEVPSVANQTALRAKEILQGAGFVAADPSVGKPAPTPDDVGMAYSSNPAHPSKREMFTPVSPVIYGPVEVTLIPVPAMKNLNLGEAVGLMAAHGDHFVYGDVALSKDRPEGSVLGQVHYSVPGAGKPVPAGTKVTLYFYPPVGDEIGNTRIIPAEIIGMPAGQAAGLLRGEDDFFAVPEAKDGDVAQNSQVPGTVQYSAPAAGSVGLRGSPVQLFVYTAPPPEEPDPEEAKTGIEPSEGDDDSWIGRWKVAGEFANKGKTTKLVGMLDISAAEDNLLMKWMPLRDGEYKEFLKLPMLADENDVLRASPQLLRKLAEEELKKNPNAGAIEQALEKSASVFVQIIRTLEIARSGNKCRLSANDPKKGPVTIHFSCVRE